MMIRVEMKTNLAEVPPDLSSSLPEEAGGFQIGKYRMTQGKQAGCELILVDFECGRVAICPTRGMSIWKAELDSVPCQWSSPVRGPVHPGLVPLDDASGIGWLEGFDELLVRCGLRSFGAPDFDDSGKLLFPLHGRIGNTPAENLKIELDAQQSTLVITADVFETRFLVYNLRLTVEYRLSLGQSKILVRDRVTNLNSTPSAIQLLYHINFGPPVLGEGSRLVMPAEQIVARDSRAAQDLEQWQDYLSPTDGYQEQVYFSQAMADSIGWAHAMLLSPDTSQAVAVHFKADSLPYFTQWKNTAAVSDGYVTGLEPGTGLPNPHGFERQQGRVIELRPGESRDFELSLEGTSQAARIAELMQEIDSLQGKSPPKLLESRPGWCLGARS